MARLLIAHHSPTRSMRTLTDRLVAGANDPEIEGVEGVGQRRGVEPAESGEDVRVER